MPPTTLADVALNLGVAAEVTLLVTEAAVDLSGGVSLLGRGVFVVEEDLLNQRLERPQPGSGSVSGQRLGMGVRMREGMPDGPSGVTKLPGDLPNGHAIAISPSNRAIIVHGSHILALRAGESIHVGTFTITKGTGVGPAYAPILPLGGSRLRFSRTFDDGASSEPCTSVLRPSLSRGVEHSRSQEDEARSTVHLPLYGLQAVHVSFNRTIAPSLCHGREDCRLIATNAFGEPANFRARRCFASCQPSAQSSLGLFADQRRELMCQNQCACQFIAARADGIKSSLRRKLAVFPSANPLE